MVVVVAPVVNDAPDVGEALEPVLVQAAVPELAVEALHEGVLGGFSGLDEVQGRAGPLAPKAHRLAGQFGAVVADDGLGMRRGLAQLVQEERQPGPGDRSGHQLADAQPGEVVDDVQDAQALAAGQLVGHEVDRPALVRPGRHRHPDPGPPRPPAPLGSDLQAKPRMDAALALAVHHQAFALEHAGRRQVTVTGMPPGQLSQAVRQRPVAALGIRTAPGRRPVHPQQAADPPLAGRAGFPEAARRLPEAARRLPEAARRLPEAARRLPEAARRLPLGGGRHHFFDISMTSSSTCLSKLRSATMRFRRRFSPSSRLRSGAVMPPYLDFQRWIGRSATPRMRARPAAEAPASRSLRIEMICSSECRLRFMRGPPSGQDSGKTLFAHGPVYGGRVTTTATMSGHTVP